MTRRRMRFRSIDELEVVRMSSEDRRMFALKVVSAQEQCTAHSRVVTTGAE